MFSSGFQRYTIFLEVPDFLHPSYMFKAGPAQTTIWYLESWLPPKHLDTLYSEENPAGKHNAIQHSEAAQAMEMLT